MTTENETRPLILASASPRRRELLALTGLAFQVAPAQVDETPLPDESPEAFVRRISWDKAETVAGQRSPGMVVAADTIVVDEGRILGKPADAAEARQMLQALRGRSHRVLTAVSVIDPRSGNRLPDLACTDVPMREYGDQEIEGYIASGDPFDKAGAYAIQHAGFRPVNGLRGCYANVMGLPLCHLARTLRRLSVTLPRDVPQACQAHTGYDCPVYQDVLEGRL